MTNRSRSTNLRTRAVAMLLATATVLGGGVLLKAWARPGPTTSYSTGALVAAAEADIAAGHPGRAILQYERASLLAPRSAAIAAGLVHARSTANLPPPSASLAVRLLERIGADVLGWIGLSGVIVAAIGLVAWAWGLAGRRGLFALIAIGGVAGLGLVAAREVSPPPNRAVVVGANVVARIAPFGKAEEAMAAPEGSEVTVERAHGGYTLIAAPDGRGWVPSDSVETILPPEGRGA